MTIREPGRPGAIRSVGTDTPAAAKRSFTIAIGSRERRRIHRQRLEIRSRKPSGRDRFTNELLRTFRVRTSRVRERQSIAIAGTGECLLRILSRWQSQVPGAFLQFTVQLIDQLHKSGGILLIASRFCRFSPIVRISFWHAVLLGKDLAGCEKLLSNSIQEWAMNLMRIPPQPSS